MNNCFSIQTEQIFPRLFALLFFSLLLTCFYVPLNAQKKVQTIGVPDTRGIYGYGFETKGGHGGKIIIVNTLNLYGPGSLAEALSTPGPRIIVFEVGGIIDMQGKVFRISAPNVTIAGQTAPDPGITLIKGGLDIKAHDVIIQHIRIRTGEAGYDKGSGWEVDGLFTSKGAYNVIIEHCSFSWATDENLSASGPRFDGANPREWRTNTSHKILFQYNIIAEGLSNSTHSKGEHSNGSLIHDNTTEIAIVRNIYANNVNRNPLFKGGSQGVIVNNFIYNPQSSAMDYKLSSSEWAGRFWIPGKLTISGNVIEFGVNTQDNFALSRFSGPCEVYWGNNRVIHSKKQSYVNTIGVPTFLSYPELWPSGLPYMSVYRVKNHLLNEAGARPWNRDLTDRRIIEEIKKGQGRIIDSENEVGGYPNVIPTYRKFNPNDWDFYGGPIKY